MNGNSERSQKVTHSNPTFNEEALREDGRLADVPASTAHLLSEASVFAESPAGSELPSTPGTPADATQLFLGASRVRRPRSRLGHPNRDRLNLYLLRHASAGTRRVNPKLDLKRPLDKEGKQHCFQLAHVLNALKIGFDLIVSSPLKRSLQTAQFVGTETGYENKILHAEALRPEAEYSQFLHLLGECRTYENVLMVGHNPTLTYFLGHLIGNGAGEGDAVQRARVRLRKGSLARVTVERGPGLLQWLLEPRIVRALYATSTNSSRRKTSRK